MSNITITLTAEQAHAVAYAAQMHAFARADQIKLAEKHPDSRGFNVKNAQRAFNTIWDAKDIIDDAIRTQTTERSLEPLLT
jgi:hypothetical protein